MMNTQLNDEDKTTAAFEQSEATRHRIGSTTYIVTRKYKQDGKEKLMGKLIRLIKNDTN